MKHLLNLTLLGLVLLIFSSCDKTSLQDDVFEGPALTPMIYHLNTDSAGDIVEMLHDSELEKSTFTGIITRTNGNSSANGIFQLGTTMATFSAMQNPSGVHGNTHVTGTGGAFFVDVRIENECISASGNMAVFGGTATHVEVADPNAPFEPGWQFFFGVRDNGQGSSSTGPDEVASAFGVVPPGFDAADFGYESWCEWFVCDLDFDCGDHGHDYLLGEDPTNIQVD